MSGSREEILATGHVTAKDFDEAAAMAMRLFAAGQRICADRWLILVDTKYELGRTREGKLVVIDEIHTPDSSRYWHAEDYAARLAKGEEPRSLDKEYVRRHFAALGYTGDGTPPPIPDEVRVEAARRYISAYELVTGRTFEPNTEDPLPRIRKNLGIN